NTNGIPIIQRNSKFKLNGTVTIKTDVDLTGSTIITTWVDNKVEYSRTNYLFSVEGNPTVDITSTVTQSQFTKGALKIPSLANKDGGSIFIDSTDLDLIRNDAGNIQNIYKKEANMFMTTPQGFLVYPLTKDYSTSTGFKVLHRKDDSRLTFNLPKVVVDINTCALAGIVRVRRNKVKLVGGYLEDLNPSSPISPVYVFADYTQCSQSEIENLSVPIIGRPTKTGDNGLGYFATYTSVCGASVKDCLQIAGWSGINGNWFRDVNIVNSKILSVSGHANTFDMTARDTTIFRNVLAHGGGTLLIDKCIINGNNSPNGGIETRQDYACEWEGEIVIRDSKVIGSNTLVYL
ncbi:hypothetical protein, partial [Bacillus mycoides]|uniref:hypothetical protein n=1 Tax=Bacillus mycoides TaxID=1405 RepID=UPI003D09001D